MAREEYIMKISMLQQESQKIEEQLQIINQHIQEFEVLKLSLSRLENNNEELLVNIGKGVFVRARPSEKDLFVNIGNNIILKKTSKETINIVNKQIEKLKDIKTALIENLEKLNQNLSILIEEAQKIEN